MALPYPGKVYVPFDILTAQELNEDVANIEALAAGTGLNSGVITTAKIADDSVTAAKVDWAATGANAGIWWEEIGRATLGVAGDTITVASLPARKYLKVLVHLVSTGGTIDHGIRFNNDAGNNYAWNRSINGTGASGTSQSYAYFNTGGAFAIDLFAEIDIVNVANREKLASGLVMDNGTGGVGNAPSRAEYKDKWVNTSVQINRIDSINAGGTGDYAIGSEMIVLGHN